MISQLALLALAACQPAPADQAPVRAAVLVFGKWKGAALAVVDFRTQEYQRITSEETGIPVWSADGQFFLYSRRQSLWLHRRGVAVDQRVRSGVRDDSVYGVSPDCEGLVVKDDTALWVHSQSAEGNNWTEVPRPKPCSQWLGMVWSPDGSELNATCRGAPKGNQEVTHWVRYRVRTRSLKTVQAPSATLGGWTPETPPRLVVANDREFWALGADGKAQRLSRAEEDALDFPVTYLEGPDLLLFRGNADDPSDLPPLQLRKRGLQAKAKPWLERFRVVGPYFTPRGDWAVFGDRTQSSECGERDPYGLRCAADWYLVKTGEEKGKKVLGQGGPTLRFGLVVPQPYVP